MKKAEIRKLVVKVYSENANDHGKLIRAMNKLLKTAREDGDYYFMGLVFRMLAAGYNSVGDREKTFINAAKSLAVSQNTDDHELIADAYITLGVAYANQENFQLALANYDKAYEIIKKHRIKGATKRILLNNMSRVYFLMGDFKSVIRYMSECMELTKNSSMDDVHELLMYTSNLAYAHMRMGDNENALKMLEDTKDLVEKATIKPYLCIYYLKISLVYYNLKNKKQGGKYLDIAFGYAEDSQDMFLIYEDLSEFVPILLKCGDKKRAAKVVELIAGYGSRNAETIDRLLVCCTLAEYYKSIGDSARAIEQYGQAVELYKTRTDELKQAQLNIHKMLKNADASINKLNKEILESEERANKDPLTKLLNRAAMLRAGGAFIDKATAGKEKVGAIFIDIDFFKECNDTYGHATGDEIIRKVADACRKEEAENICFARYGGDEFLGLTCGFSDEAVADIARRICARIREADIPNEKNPNGHRVTLSVGIANVSVTKKTDTIIQIVNYADKAVYYSKNAGKNCIHLLNHGRRKDNGFDKIDF